MIHKVCKAKYNGQALTISWTHGFIIQKYNNVL